MQLTSSAFSQGGAIPKRYTCEGQDTSPELSWSDAPTEAKSFALILHDPDAPVPVDAHRNRIHELRLGGPHARFEILGELEVGDGFLGVVPGDGGGGIVGGGRGDGRGVLDGMGCGRGELKRQRKN